MTAGLWSLPFIPLSSGISLSLPMTVSRRGLKKSRGIISAKPRNELCVANSAELQSQLRLQDATAALLRQRRHDAGALTFHTAELQPVLADGEVVDLQTRRQNRASLLIEDFMIAANQASAAFLDAKGSPGIQRVVQTPH